MKINQNIDSESGTTYLENPPKRRVFTFLHPDSPSNSVRLFAAQRLTPLGPARQARCSTPAALVRVRAPLFKEPAQKAVFCFSASGRFIELRSITRCPAALRLRGPGGRRNARPVGRIRHLCRHPAQPWVQRLMCIARRMYACAVLRCLNQQRTRRPDKAFMPPSGTKAGYNINVNRPAALRLCEPGR